ncbi:MAG: FAD-dependent oxidoreductase, partial [Myxococcota bacterium]
MDKYDLVVIGSGPAGEKGAAQAAYFGKRVALIESRVDPGGVCVHTGTVPSKTLRETSLYLSGVKSRGLYGVNYLVKRDVSARDFMYRRIQVVNLEVERIRRNFDRHRIDVIGGKARFTDTNTVEVVTRDGTSRSVSGEKFLIATGSTPFHPDTLPFEDQWVFDSDTMLDMAKLPRSLCIIGAGVIGCEYATIFAALGLRVILLDARDQLLPFLDKEIAEELRQQMMQLGVQFINNARVAHVKRTDDDALTIALEGGEDFDVESVLFAAGRQGNTAQLGLDVLGIEPTKRGHIEVNENFQSTAPHVYAAGDVVGFPALAS